MWVCVYFGAAMGMGFLWDGYGDCDESPWACGNSVGIFDVRLSGNVLNM